MAPSLPVITQRRPQRKPTGHESAQGRRLHGVESLPVLQQAPVVTTVHVYEHIHDHHHFVFQRRRRSSSVPSVLEPLPERQRPSIPEVAVLPACEAERVECVLHSPPPHPDADDTLHLPLTLGPDHSAQSNDDADGGKTSQPLQSSSLLQVLPDRSRGLESRGSVASSRLSSWNVSDGDSKSRGSKEPPAKLRRVRSVNKLQAPEDKLSTRLRVLEAESRWSDRRRDLRRYIRELPDSSKSKAKQKLVGQQVTGTLIDKTRN